jgi:hypothetical protein
MESQSWLSCFCSSQNWLLLLPFVIKKGRARISTKVHILWCTHWCLAIGRTQLDTMIHWLMSLAPTNEDSAWLAEVKPCRKNYPLQVGVYRIVCVVSFVISNNMA